MQEYIKKIVDDFHWEKPTYYTSLFQSCGIGEFYLKENLGLVGAVSNELLPQRAKWAQELYPECNVVCGDIWDKDVFEKLVQLHKEKGCMGVIASPACQSYSLSNSKRNPSDKRGHLFEPTLEFVRRTNPEWVMIENVPQMLTVKLDDGRVVGKYIVEQLKKMGYIVHYGVQNAANFFVPQNRRRAVILARKAKAWEFPKPFDEVITLRDAIGDLPSLECGQRSHLKYHVAPMWALPQIEVMKHTPTGCSAHDNLVWKPVNVDGSPSKARFHCSFQRKTWDEPCNTILCNSKSISGFRTCHPGRPLEGFRWSDSRPLTVLELLRVTGLPDDYPIPEWASDKLIRDAFGECYVPLNVLANLRGLF